MTVDRISTAAQTAYFLSQIQNAGAALDKTQAQIAQRMRDVIRKRIENGEWLASEWIEQAHPQQIRDAIRNYIKESDWLNSIVTANDASEPHASDNSLER